MRKRTFALVYKPIFFLVLVKTLKKGIRRSYHPIGISFHIFSIALVNLRFVFFFLFYKAYAEMEHVGFLKLFWNNSHAIALYFFHS